MSACLLLFACASPTDEEPSEQDKALVEASFATQDIYLRALGDQYGAWNALYARFPDLDGRQVRKDYLGGREDDIPVEVRESDEYDNVVRATDAVGDARSEFHVALDDAVATGLIEVRNQR